MRIDLNIIFDLDNIHPTTVFGERFNIVLVHVEVTTESWYFLGKTYSKCCKKSHSYGFLKENIHKTKMIVCCWSSSKLFFTLIHDNFFYQEFN